jgi:membrane protein implicated in regulation of membrane protease activity
MDLWLMWVIAGFVLVIAELVTGTFYLLVVGLGAFAGAAVAWLGGNAVLQAVVGGAVAMLGTWLVHVWHAAQPKDLPHTSNFLDRGQAVVMESWANEGARVARVKYRGTTWDARVMAPDAPLVPGATLYIEGQEEGGMLLVGAAPPAR